MTLRSLITQWLANRRENAQLHELDRQADRQADNRRAIEAEAKREFWMWRERRDELDRAEVTLRKRVAPIKRRAALRAVGK